MTTVWQLAIETSGREGSFALLDRDQPQHLFTISSGMRTAAQFATALQQLLQRGGLQPDQIGLVSVAEGPGSFTGLRIGVTAAKTFCFAVGCPAVAVSTLDQLAFQAAQRISSQQEAPARLCVAIDAYRGQFYRSEVVVPGGDAATRVERWRVVRADAAVDARQWHDELEQLVGESAEPVWLVGPAAAKAATIASVNSLPDIASNATAVGQLAWQYYERGRHDDFYSLRPNYLRASAAEEKLGAAP